MRANLTAAAASRLTLAPEVERQLTVQEVADVLGVAPKSVLRWVYDGDLTAYRYGRGRGIIRIEPADLRAFRTRIGAPVKRAAR